jgi:hypothetical protein
MPGRDAADHDDDALDLNLSFTHDDDVIGDDDVDFIAFIRQHHDDLSRLRDQHCRDHTDVYDWAGDDDWPNDDGWSWPNDDDWDDWPDHDYSRPDDLEPEPDDDASPPAHDRPTDD